MRIAAKYERCRDFEFRGIYRERSRGTFMRGYTVQTDRQTLPALRLRLRASLAVIRARKLRLPPRTTAEVGSLDNDGLDSHHEEPPTVVTVLNKSRAYTFHCYVTHRYLFFTQRVKYMSSAAEKGTGGPGRGRGGGEDDHVDRGRGRGRGTGRSGRNGIAVGKVRVRDHSR